MSAIMHFSRGSTIKDNCPAQLEAQDFDAFAETVLNDRGRLKGEIYIAGPMRSGPHPSAPEKYPGEAPWRSKDLALPRAFLPLDLDGFESPAAYEVFRCWLEGYRAFGHTTASHTPEKPRYRAILSLSRPVDRDECMRLGEVIATKIKQDLGDGMVKFDDAVYKPEQAIYTPLVDADSHRYGGEVIDVDDLLSSHRLDATHSVSEVAVSVSPLDEVRDADPVFRALEKHDLIKRHLGGGKYAIECPYDMLHSSDTAESSTVYYLPNTGGYREGGFCCMHDNCRDHTQDNYRRAIGIKDEDLNRFRSRQRASTTYKCRDGRYEVTEDGVYFLASTDDDEAPKRIWLSAPIELLARTRDHRSGDWGKLLRWRDADGVEHIWAMPMKILQGDPSELRREFAQQGLQMATGSKARGLFIAFLDSCETDRRARCVGRPGWHDNVFVTPDEMIGDDDELVVYQGTTVAGSSFSSSGSVEQWRNAVARLAAGNTRLQFAISVALAAPLADIASEDGGGFHFIGKTSCGKTTVLRAAASVWGDPAKYPREWRATANGLEGVAVQHNDGLLILDELNQIDPREAGEASYLLANGQGKSRAGRTGAARPVAQWRVLFLSAGEQSLSTIMSSVGKKVTAGQEVRLVEIDADAGADMGIFETLHELDEPGEMALRIKEVALQYHGAVGRAWLELIVANRKDLEASLPDRIRKCVDGMLPNGATGQAARVARRMALVAVAGELASEYGLTPWTVGAATDAASTCFRNWYQTFGGSQSREDKALLDQVRAFFEAHGESRFVALDKSVFENLDSMSVSTADDGTPRLVRDDHVRVHNRAGYRVTNGDGLEEYWVLPLAFRNELCKGFSQRYAAKVLVEKGWLTRGSDGKNSLQRRLPGLGPTRVYVINPAVWGENHVSPSK